MPIWQKAWAAAKAKGDVLFRGKRINRDPSLDDNNNPSGFDRAGKVRLKSQMKRSTSSFTDNPKPVSLVKPAASQLVGETGRRSALPDKELGTVSSLSEPTFSVDQDSTSDFTAVVTIDDLGFSDGPKLSNNDIEGFKKVSSVVNEKTADMTRTIDQSLRRQYQLSRGDSDEKYFVPIDQIYQILSMERVRDYLEDLFPDESKPKINAMAEAICGSDAGGMRRILATLILIGESNSIAGLIRCGLHDDNLPLRIRTNRSRKVVLSPSRQRNDEYEDDEELVDDSEMDIVFSDWKGYKIRDFHRTQYTFTVPIFRMPSDRIHFYRINSDIVLPFVDKERRVEGRFGLVSKVKMHPAHVETNSEAKDMELFFAVKEFPWRYRDAFREELRNLERFSGPNRGHDHIIRLCAAFQHGETRSLIFPWADEDLAKFWSSKKASPDSKEDVEWFAHQSLGIASAVEKLHGRVSWGNLRNSDTDRMTRGRHGDIKPENILCFEDTTPRRPRLVISDFGAMHFFTDKTVKDIPLKDIRELSIAYRPPEMDIQTTISQKSDIWSLGCVFLEFISWLLLGTDARNDFAKARVGDGEPNYPIAVAFFQLASKAGDEDGQYLAKLKPSVHSWIRKLRSGCSEFIHDFLDLIQLEMLNPDPKLRPHSDDIATRLRYMVRRIEYDDNYAVWASRWTPRTTPQATTTGRLRQMTNMVDHESFTDKLLTDIYLDLKYKQTFFQMRNLRGNIDANIIRSAAAFGGERFLPADQIVTLVTKDVVAQELKLAGVEPTDGLVEFTLREARVVFLTLSHTMNLQAFKALQANNFTDDCLPVKTTPGLTNGGDFRWIVDRFVGASHQAGRSSPGRWDGFDDWSSLQVENFAESQWLFLAPVLGVSYHSRVLQANTPMPFLETSELSSTTHKVWVHPSHIETDVTLHVSNSELSNPTRDREPQTHVLSETVPYL
ncbi:kinase-like domain-containing protein [Xylariaceae sp. FL1019]|nr:kinase-like domain-containing protein [Xylariaceae sp. FL1019]